MAGVFLNVLWQMTPPGLFLQRSFGKYLRMCGLEEYADTIVSSLGTEPHKHTTIAVELVVKVRVSNLLAEVVLPNGPIPTNFAVINQPSAEPLVFNRLLLLRKGRQNFYFGNIGENSSIIPNYFEHNGAPRCDSDANS
ncbi:hypothetical protein DFH29DRAFT_870006 [Suillus ampliporus]|nr:hypothetical protein DFH29DRAFT_870006 [Suillus ampliporus]